jgi:hypothetical protein
LVIGTTPQLKLPYDIPTFSVRAIGDNTRSVRGKYGGTRNSVIWKTGKYPNWKAAVEWASPSAKKFWLSRLHLAYDRKGLYRKDGWA